MTSTLTSLECALQFAEAEVLRDAGFVVKNTFIDEPSTCLACARRTSSAPPKLQRCMERTISSLPSQVLGSDCCTPRAVARPMSWTDDVAMFDTVNCDWTEHPTACKFIGSSVCSESPMSTAYHSESSVVPVDAGLVSTTCHSECSVVPAAAGHKHRQSWDMSPAGSANSSTSSTEIDDGSDMESTTSDAESPHGNSGETLPELVKRECQFLRIVDCTLHPLDAVQGRKLPVSGVTHCLRVCVIGLPSLKRHKWEQPLAWSVAKVLQRAGCEAIVKRGVLLTPMTGNCDDLVRVDFCAPRPGELFH